jgi:hypothetical protein
MILQLSDIGRTSMTLPTSFTKDLAALIDDVKCFDGGIKTLQEIERELRFDSSEGNQERYENVIGAIDHISKYLADAQKELSAAIEYAQPSPAGTH